MAVERKRRETAEPEAASRPPSEQEPRADGTSDDSRRLCRVCCAWAEAAVRRAAAVEGRNPLDSLPRSSQDSRATLNVSPTCRYDRTGTQDRASRTWRLALLRLGRLRGPRAAVRQRAQSDGSPLPCDAMVKIAVSESTEISLYRRSSTLNAVAVTWEGADT